jgi:hypothetical protein
MKELLNISSKLKESPNCKKLIENIGLKYNTTNYRKVVNYIKENNLDDSHFKHPVKKLDIMLDSVFIGAVESSNSVGEIIKKLNLNESYYKKIHQKMDQLSLSFGKIKYLKWSVEEIELLKQNYPTCSPKELKKIFPNRTIESLHRYASLNGFKKQIKNFSSAIDILLNDDLESYYWIGFILADGSTDEEKGRLKIAVSKKDLNHLKKFQDYIKCEKLITNSKQSCNALGKEDLSVICVYNKDIVKKINQKFDIKKQKTYNPPDVHIFDNLTIDQMISLIIGYIDGDGCIYKHLSGYITIQIVSHQSWLPVFLYWVNIISETYDIISPTPKVNYNGLAQIGLNKKTLIHSLKNFGIKNNLPILQRKWAKILL